MTADGYIALLIAPFIGSFLGVVIDRLPQGRPIVAGRSACDHCGHRLGPIELLPLLSFWLQEGRCRHCRLILRPFYPSIELAALAVAISAVFFMSGWLLWASLLLGWSLLALAIIDHRHLILPDPITLPLIPAGLAAAYALRPEAIMAHVIGAILGFSLFAGTAFLYRRLRKREGLGLGDAKLLAAAGAWLGWHALPGLVLLAAATALLVALAPVFFGGRLDRHGEIAFGPYLALAFWLSWLLGPPVLG